MYKLYSIAGSCSTAITVLLTNLGLEFKVIQRSEVESYKDIVPTGQVPALDDNGQIITEGAAIVLYLLEKHRSEMLPNDLSNKAEFLQYLMFNYATLHPAYSKVMAIGKNYDGDDASKIELMQKVANGVSSYWEILDKRLSNRKYIVGDKPSIIDYLVTIYTGWGKFFPPVSIDLGNNVNRLAKEISRLPEFISACELEKLEFKIWESNKTPETA